MLKKYNPLEFENRWQEYWEKEQIYRSPELINSQNKRYCLSMFPYPSGDGLHVGHVRIYTGTDVLARYFRMKGLAVLHPMGWDAFGLPAENAAIKAQKNPLEMVPKNIANFKRQMQTLGFSYDWSREFATTDPDYYRFTQWLFIEFFKLGLLYKKDTPVYYCPFCKTGLAEEEVLPNGTHERCGKTITRKNLPQWIFRITEYADSLLESLDGLDWPNGILEMQRNWIGKNKGLEITFTEKSTGEPIAVWTRFWETVFGTTFMVLAPEHALVKTITKPEVLEYVRQALAKTDEQRLKDEKDKTGVFTGLYAVNPVNGREVPIYVADYVLSNVGTGAVMGVPAHDERDFAFAQKYDLPIIQVVKFAEAALNTKVANGKLSHEGAGTLINSGEFNGLATPGEGKTKMAESLIKRKFACWRTNYHLRDWIFSRQRYWGEPIPIVYCPACARAGISYWDTAEGKANKHIQSNAKLTQKVAKRVEQLSQPLAGYFPLQAEELPLELPFIKNYEPAESGESPLARVSEWVKTKCPRCGGEATRETDTMPNWAGSCWYFLRFAQNITPGVIRGDGKGYKGKKNPKDELLSGSDWLPVDWYLGGAEHAVLHLLYARFWVHILNDLGMLSFREPFLRLRNVGMVLATDHRKMSKSLGNVVNPDSVVQKYGADTLRVYEMFMAPFSMEIAWSERSMLGANRFLNKIYQTYLNPARIAKEGQEEDSNLVAKLQTTVRKVSDDIANVKFNTAVAALMEFLNAWQKGVLSPENAQKYLQLLAPFAPFLAEELWQKQFKNTTSVHLSVWPTPLETAKIKAKLTIPVQVNNKLRALLKVDSDTAFSATKMKTLVLADPKIASYLSGHKYRVVFVPGKILSYVLE